VPKFGIRFPILDAHQFSRSKFKQSKVKVTDKWGIPNPAATLLVSITIMYSKIKCVSQHYIRLFTLVFIGLVHCLLLTVIRGVADR